MEISTDSSSSSHNQPHLPPGFRFHPTDEELVVHYLKKKASSAPLPVTIIAEVDLYKFDPWELPGKATFGEQEWYFFSPRDRKYPNGARPNRAATSGYWKATGTDKPILTSGGTQKVGVKKALVFYGGKPPKGIKTNWIMHEYRLITDNHNGNSMKPPSATTDLSGKKSSLRLDDWVLCRIYKKNNNTSQRPLDQSSSSREDSMEEMLVSSKPQITAMKAATNYSELIENDDEDHFFEDLLSEGGGGVNIQHTSNHDISKHVENGSSVPMGPVSTQSLKRSLPQQPYNYGEAGVAPASKRFSGSSTAGGSAASAAIVMDQAGNNGTSNSISALLNQLPPQAVHQFHQQSVLVGSLSDGVFGRQPYQQLSGMNWNS